MTGIGAMIAGDGPYSGGGGGGGGGGGPLACSVTTRSGATAYNVAGASGSADLVDSTVSGGTPPYTTSYTVNGISGKFSINDPSGSDALIYSGFSLNEIEFCSITFMAHDSLGATVSATFPASSTISVKRTS